MLTVSQLSPTRPLSESRSSDHVVILLAHDRVQVRVPLPFPRVSINLSKISHFGLCEERCAVYGLPGNSEYPHKRRQANAASDN